jgi:hypothetical protein
LLESGELLPFDGLNVPRGEGDLLLYTPQFYAATPASKETVLEVEVQLERPLMLLPNSQPVTGTVRAVADGKGETLIPFDSIVLSASGEASQALSSRVSPGTRLGIAQEIRHLEPGCQAPSSISWARTYAALAGSYVFLRDGVIQPLGDLGALLHNPRTAVAFNDQYIYFIVVDGRDLLHSQGMSMVELAVFARNYLGAAWGMALDGGGSSTLVVNGQVRNNPNAETTTRPHDPKQARDVANALLMVVAQPRQQSTRFQPGERVSIPGPAQVNLRLGPGTNYAIQDFLAPGSQGVALAHPLNGVLAKGYNWWQIDFGNRTGWVSESELARP